MDAYIEKIVKSVYDAQNAEELFHLKGEISTHAFCGLHACYDLEEIIFNRVSAEERTKILEHIKRIYDTHITHTPHIFIQREYYQHLPSAEKCIIDADAHFITVLTTENEVLERARASPKNADYIHYEGVKGQADNIGLETFASNVLQKIWNYSQIFPEFQPIFIGKYSTKNVAICKKLLRLPQFLGALLQNDKDVRGLNKKIGIFKNRYELNVQLDKLLTKKT